MGPFCQHSGRSTLEPALGNGYVRCFLVLDGKVMSVVRREPAYVIGDGQKTLLQLISSYNGQPGIGKSKPLCPIVFDYELERNLEKQNLTLDDIIEKGKKRFLRKNANVSTGGRSFECTEEAHPAYMAMAIQIAEMFHLRFCAVDLMALDISKFENFAIIEINSDPGFEINEFPFRGKPVPVSEELIKAMFR